MSVQVFSPNVKPAPWGIYRDGVAPQHRGLWDGLEVVVPFWAGDPEDQRAWVRTKGWVAVGQTDTSNILDVATGRMVEYPGTNDGGYVTGIDSAPFGWPSRYLTMAYHGLGFADVGSAMMLGDAADNNINNSCVFVTSLAGLGVVARRINDVGSSRQTTVATCQITRPQLLVGTFHPEDGAEMWVDGLQLGTDTEARVLATDATSLDLSWGFLWKGGSTIGVGDVAVAMGVIYLWSRKLSQWEMTELAIDGYCVIRPNPMRPAFVTLGVTVALAAATGSYAGGALTSSVGAVTRALVAALAPFTGSGLFPVLGAQTPVLVPATATYTGSALVTVTGAVTRQLVAAAATYVGSPLVNVPGVVTRALVAAGATYVGGALAVAFGGVTRSLGQAPATYAGSVLSPSVGGQLVALGPSGATLVASVLTTVQGPVSVTLVSADGTFVAQVLTVQVGAFQVSLVAATATWSVASLLPTTAAFDNEVTGEVIVVRAVEGGVVVVSSVEGVVTVLTDLEGESII